MFSKALLGTNKDSNKLTWFEYIWFSCIIQGWYNCCISFRYWADLMGNSYQDYGLLDDEDDLEICIDYFWDSLNDEIYSKEFLEMLMQMSDDVKSGKVKVQPITENFLTTMNELFESPSNENENELK